MTWDGLPFISDVLASNIVPFVVDGVIVLRKPLSSPDRDGEGKLLPVQLLLFSKLLLLGVAGLSGGGSKTFILGLKVLL